MRDVSFSTSTNSSLPAQEPCARSKRECLQIKCLPTDFRHAHATNHRVCAIRKPSLKRGSGFELIEPREGPARRFPGSDRSHCRYRGQDIAKRRRRDTNATILRTMLRGKRVISPFAYPSSLTSINDLYRAFVLIERAEGAALSALQIDWFAARQRIAVCGARQNDPKP